MDFTGRSPFTYTASYNGKRFTKTTSSPTATFSTGEDGVFRLEEFSDFFNYTVRPEVQVAREVRFVAPPTYNLNIPEYSCDHADLNVEISLKGQAPFTVEYPLII